MNVTTCACGCGGLPSRRARYLRGHNRTEIPKRRLREAMASPGSCWVWPGCLVDGYGEVQIGGRCIKAHRWVWALMRAPINGDTQLDHLCRNRACVNPDHLELVTSRENTLRGIGPTAINARKTHCKHGHEFTPENTQWRSPTKRECLACVKRRNAEQSARRRVRNPTPTADESLPGEVAGA